MPLGRRVECSGPSWSTCCSLTKYGEERRSGETPAIYIYIGVVLKGSEKKNQIAGHVISGMSRAHVISTITSYLPRTGAPWASSSVCVIIEDRMKHVECREAS
jgi:hypothetical protein